MRLLVVALVSIGAVLFLCGCPPETFPEVVSPTLAEIDAIRNSTTLSAAQMRTQLAALGLVPETINGLLKDQRTGNQYGGDLRTAYAKVTLPDFTKLTPDEVQIYDDAAGSVDPNLSFSITDAQAQAIVTLFVTYALTSPDTLQTFLDDPTSEIPSTIPDNLLEPLFIDFDPNDLLPILP